MHVDTVKKIKKFIAKYVADTDLQVVDLCKSLKLGRASLYAYLNQEGISLTELRRSAVKKVLSPTEKRGIVSKIDDLRGGGATLKEALAKANVKACTYQYCKSSLTGTKHRDKGVKSSLPVVTPHTIEYLGTPKNSRAAPMMLMVGSPSDLAAFALEFNRRRDEQ